MKKAMFLLGFCGMFGFLFASDEPADFSGTWMLDVNKSYVGRRTLNESDPLVIAQTANGIRISVNASGRRVGFESFRLDGEKEVLRLRNGHEITIKAKLKGNKFEVETENRYSGKISKTKKKYSLSKDGKTLKLESPGSTLVYKKVDTMVGSASQPENLASQTTILAPEYYAAASIESVKKQRADTGLHFEIMGEPVLKPDISGLYASVPDAIVLVNLNSGTIVREQAMVLFSDNRPARTLFSPKKSPFSQGILDRTELQQVTNEVGSFFATAVDVGRGNERFYPYLPDDIRSLFKNPDRKFRMYMPPGAVNPSWREKLATETVSPHPLEGLNGWREKLSDDELRSFAALQLDALVHQSLLLLNGFVKEATDLANRQRPQALVSDPRKFMTMLEESISQNMRLLEKAKFLTPDRLKLTSNYMKRLTGYGFVVKEVSEPDPCPCFISSPEDATLYITSFGSLSGGLAMHFRKENGNLRIVCMALP